MMNTLIERLASFFLEMAIDYYSKANKYLEIATFLLRGDKND